MEAQQRAAAARSSSSVSRSSTATTATTTSSRSSLASDDEGLRSLLSCLQCVWRLDCDLLGHDLEDGHLVSLVQLMPGATARQLQWSYSTALL